MKRDFCKIIKVAILFLELVWNSKFVTSNLSSFVLRQITQWFNKHFIFFFNSANVLMILMRSLKTFII